MMMQPGSARSDRSAWSVLLSRPEDPTSLGVLRLIVGLGLLARLLLAAPGSSGLALDRSGPWGIALVWLALGGFGLFGLGLFSRLAAPLALLLMAATLPGSARGPSGLPHPFLDWTLLMALGGVSGHAVSLDRFRRRLKHLRASFARPAPPGGRTVSTGVPVATTTDALVLRSIQLDVLVRDALVGLAVLRGPAATAWSGPWLALVVGHVAFVPGSWLRRLVTGPPAAQPAGTVLYDGACPRCRRALAWLTAADPDHLLWPVDLTTVDVRQIDPRLDPAACLRAMHLVTRDGDVLAGHDAVMRLACWLPLYLPFGLVGRLPGVAALGRRAYNAVAARRLREPCTDDTCALAVPEFEPPEPAGSPSPRSLSHEP